jgi:hypothetical protein
VNKLTPTAARMEDIRREDIMTDYQFKTILKMVLDLAESSNDIEKIKKSLRNLIGEKTETEKDSEIA